MTSATVDITGRLTADPVLRSTKGETTYSVVNFTVAHTPRRRNASGDWEDAGDALFLRVTAWTKLADAAAQSLHKGDLVTVRGQLGVRYYETEGGEHRLEVTCQAESIAVALGGWQTATVIRSVAPADSAGDDWAPSPATRKAAAAA